VLITLAPQNPDQLVEKPSRYFFTLQRIASQLEPAFDQIHFLWSKNRANIFLPCGESHLSSSWLSTKFIFFVPKTEPIFFTLHRIVSQLKPASDRTRFLWPKKRANIFLPCGESHLSSSRLLI
jgi:hypothetical protein